MMNHCIDISCSYSYSEKKYQLSVNTSSLINLLAERRGYSSLHQQNTAVVF